MNLWDAEIWECSCRKPHRPRPCRKCDYDEPEECGYTILGMDCNGNLIISIKRKRTCIVNGCLTSCTRYY